MTICAFPGFHMFKKIRGTWYCTGTRYSSTTVVLVESFLKGKVPVYSTWYQVELFYSMVRYTGTVVFYFFKIAQCSFVH